MQKIATLESRVATAPGGLVLTVTSESSVNLADPNDALRLTTLTDMVSVNSRPFTRTYDADTKTFTNTTLGMCIGRFLLSLIIWWSNWQLDMD